MSSTPDLLGRLQELQQAAGAEVLVDTGAYLLGGQRQWCRVRKVSPYARFPVTVTIPVVGAATYRPDEILDAREATHGRR